MLLISLMFLYAVPASLAVLRQATATLQDKMRLVGSCERSSISSDGSSSGATAAELKDVKMKNVGEFSSPEEMVRHMVQRAMKASIEQRKRLLIHQCLRVSYLDSPLRARNICCDFEFRQQNGSRL